jgi:hypothetical protein
MTMVTPVDATPEDPTERAAVEYVTLLEASDDALRDLYNAITRWLDAKDGDNIVALLTDFYKAQDVFVEAHSKWKSHYRSHGNNEKLREYVCKMERPKDRSFKNTFLRRK